MIRSTEMTETRSRPIRVAVYLADQNPHRDRSLGITSMTRSLLDELNGRREVSLTILTSRSSFGATGRRESSHRLPFRTDGLVGRLISDTMHPLLLYPKADLWYYPKGYLSLVSRPSVPVVGTMHDAIIQHYADRYPESRSPRQFRYWISVMKNSLKRSDAVMTVSQHAKGQLEQFCDRHRITPPPIHVTYESSSWESNRHQKWDKGRGAVHLASMAPHKQTNRLLEMWGQLQLAGRELPPLRLIGQVDRAGERVLAQLKHASIEPQLTDHELVEAIATARVLLLPSEIEGFGLPALEAYYVGTPVCFVSGTSVEEVVTPSGRFGAFDLASFESLGQAVDSALNQTESTLVEFSESLFNRFSTGRFADRVIETFSDVLEQANDRH